MLAKLDESNCIFLQLAVRCKDLKNLPAQECCKDIQVDDLTSEEGPEYIVSALDTFYFEKVSVEGIENLKEEAIEAISDLCARRSELPETCRSSDNQDDAEVLKDKRCLYEKKVKMH